MNSEYQIPHPDPLSLYELNISHHWALEEIENEAKSECVDFLSQSISCV